MAELSDVYEPASEAVEAAVEIMRGVSIPAAVGIGVIALAGGAAIGYFVASKRLQLKYQKLAEEEIETMREHFRRRTMARETKPDLESLKAVTTVHNYGDPATPGKVAEIVSKAPRSIPPLPPTSDPEEIERRNAFNEDLKKRLESTSKDADEDWDYEVELANRSAEVPYVIHEDERREGNYTDVDFTYYEVDDVLADERDGVLDPNERVNMIGPDALDKFGHGSGDRQVVFVRNDALQIDIAITRANTSYAQDVAGFSHEAYEPMGRREGRRRGHGENRGG